MSSLVAVIGTVFMDCKGFAKGTYHPAGRNLAEIQFVHGGVGRNVAENLARLEIPVALASSVDATGIGNEIVERLERVGVRTDFLHRTASHGMGMWLAILENDGNLAGSVSQMPDVRFLDEVVSRRGEELMRSSSHIALEIDLSEAVSRKVSELAKAHGKPLYGIPGNMGVTTKHPELLRGMECFICNDIEASQLMGVPVLELEPDAACERLAAYAASVGLRSLVVTLGSQGALFYDAAAKDGGYQPVFPVNVVDTTGAGDAFFSGTVMGLVRGLTLRQAVICGTKVAGWTIESPENNCMDLGERMKRDEVLQELLTK